MASSRARRGIRRRNVVIGGATVLVVAAGGTAWGLTAGSGASYRTAQAGHATVSQTLSATGTVSPVSNADEAFQVAGTVAKVSVKTGQKVRAGQLLAHLNRSALRAQLHQAQSTLASARNRMASDQSGQSSAASRSSSSTPTFQASEPTPVQSSPPSGSGTSNGSGTANLAKLQSAVRDAQQLTDEALGAARAALQAANAACSSQTSASSTPEPDASTSPDPQPTSPSTSDCTQAGTALLAMQQQVSDAENRLADAETALTRAVAAMVDAADSSSRSSTPSSSSSPSRATPTSGSTVSAADIALDQANIDQAQATVATYKADLAEATLRATIDGKVAAVSVTRGDRVSASSDTAAVTIVGSQQEQTTISLSATEIRRVKVAMPARVVIDGSSKALTGRVVTINAAGTQSSTGIVSYPVTIALPDGTDAVSGAAASVTVVVATVENVLSVPTSAVHYNGTSAYVQVLRNGKPIRRTVKVGAVGAALTQINSGLTDGQQIVLADLNAALPSSSSSVNRGFGGLGGGGGGNFRRFTRGTGGSFPAPPSGASFG